MKRSFPLVLILILISSLSFSQSANKSEVQQRADKFLSMYDSLYQKMYTVDSEANWAAGTDVSDLHTGQRIGADSAYAAFLGSPYIINEARELLKRKDFLDSLTVRQLDKILYNGAHAPGTIPEIVAERIAAEANQSATLDSFEFCMEREGDNCAKPITVNQIDDTLRDSRDLAERKKVWEVSKQSGVALKPGLIELQRLRNRIAKETGFNSYFALEVSDYGMTSDELVAMTQK